ncbi:MAG: PD40 domain-containing protein [Anaerolineales bacterium]|nr:PD40 domain-containing protein [Anaerolineales bacterium]
MALSAYGPRRASSCSTWWAGLGSLGLLLGLGLAAFVSLPRLTAVYPANGTTQVSARAPIKLEFSRPMDTTSVEQALAITPDVPGRLTWVGNTLIFTPALAWPLNATINVALAGARSQRGLPLLGGEAWSFQIGTRRLAFLAGSQRPNLWVLPVEAGSSAQPLTDEPYGIYDYAVSPDGTRIVYAARRADGGADLRQINADGSGRRDVLVCSGEACVSPAIAPDGERLAYQRHALVPGLTGALGLGAAHVYVRPVDAPANDPGQQMSENEARFPRWAPDGRLSYLDTGREAVVIHDLVTGALSLIPNSSGEMGAWSPDATFIVYPELAFPAGAARASDHPGPPEAVGGFYTSLTRVTIATNVRQTLSGPGLVDDSSPAFSPSGGWLAFGRKRPEGEQWTLGRQLWLMRPDGSEAHALTADPLYNHSAFTWSPDGQLLAYMRFNTDNLEAPAEIWLTSIDPAGQLGPGAAGPRRLTQGYLPEWLP